MDLEASVLAGTRATALEVRPSQQLWRRRPAKYHWNVTKFRRSRRDCGHLASIPGQLTEQWAPRRQKRSSSTSRQGVSYRLAPSTVNCLNSSGRMLPPNLLGTLPNPMLAGHVELHRGARIRFSPCGPRRYRLHGSRDSSGLARVLRPLEMPRMLFDEAAASGRAVRACPS